MAAYHEQFPVAPSYPAQFAADTLSTPPPNPSAVAASMRPAWMRGSALPMAGGMAGAAIGSFAGPLAPAARPVLSAVLGGAGEAGREKLSGEPLNLDNIMNEAGKQGLWGLGGEVVAGPLRAWGGKATESASGLTAALAKRFPGLAKVIAHERVAPGASLTAGGKLGSQEIGERLGAAAGEVKSLLAKMPQTISPEDLAQDALSGLEQHMLDVFHRMPTPDERANLVEAIRKQANALLDQRARGQITHDLTEFTPLQVKLIKQSAQQATKNVPAAIANATLNPNADPNLVRDLATGTRKLLDPTIGGLERKVQGLTGAKVALTNAEAKIAAGSPSRLPFIPSLAQAAIPAEARSPWLVSRIGLGMTSAPAQATALIAPRLMSLAHPPKGADPAQQIRQQMKAASKRGDLALTAKLEQQLRALEAQP